MPTTSSLVLAAIISSGFILGAQESGERSKLPRNGDDVVVKGCLNGAMLEASETRLADGSGSAETPYNFQLKGKKDLVRQLRKEHDGSHVEVSGRLRSSLEVPRGTRIGRTGIYIGAGGPMDRPGLGHDRIMPVLEVRAYEGSGERCRR